MSAAIPKVVQRFRARELQRLVNTAGLLNQRAGVDTKPYVYMKDTKVADVPMNVAMHNPFLPRAIAARSSAGKVSGERQKKERKRWMGPQYSLRRQADIVKAARASGTLHLLPPGPKLSVEELEAAKKEYRLRAVASKETSRKVAEAVRKNKPTDRTGTAESEGPVAVDSQETPVDPIAALQKHIRRTRWAKRTPGELQQRRNSAILGYPGIVFRWSGKAPAKRTRLTIYAGRRRMFKGHKWERHMQKRRNQIGARMRDMQERISRFKNVYKKRKAQPLKPAPSRKKESLPF